MSDLPAGWEDGKCHVPTNTDPNRCAYAGPDGTDACGEFCRWRPLPRDTGPSAPATAHVRLGDGSFVESGEPMVTKTGRVLTEADVQVLAAKAEGSDREALRELMVRLLSNTGAYAGDYPGDCADRVLDLLIARGWTPNAPSTEAKGYYVEGETAGGCA